ncbi:hypothetical protein [Sphingobium sp. EM0848]|uniref:hypothetical protein n=1 Tax=Sphingobium sp. EM0848 TaxID=2743473 RepID=UPI00159C29B1|nr:hypothetical protein [Sphingobium sp. EM0848]
MAEFESLNGEDDWDQVFADDLIGCTLLVGLTFVDHADDVIRRQQIFGVVETVDKGAGITLRQQTDGELFTIAPVLEAIQPGEPGIYQLSDTDEKVEDPDFTALITVRAPHRC